MKRTFYAPFAARPSLPFSPRSEDRRQCERRFPPAAFVPPRTRSWWRTTSGASSRRTPAASALTALPHAELTRRPLDDFVPSSHRARLRERREALLAAGSTQGRCRFQRPDGSERPRCLRDAREHAISRLPPVDRAARATPEADPSDDDATSTETDAPLEQGQGLDGDGIFGELWDTLRAVATDPALVDALEGGQRERDERSDVA